MSHRDPTLARHGLRPHKSKGQHFLVDDAVLDRIAQAAGIGPDETVIEIGPGTGNLTRRLLAAARRVVAVEIDRDLCDLLREEFRTPLEQGRLDLVLADALTIDWRTIEPGARLKLAANIPYNITTQLIFGLLEARERFSDLFLLVQREVAERIVAQPGGRDYGIISAQTQLLFDCAALFEVGPEAFAPRPRVASTLLRMTPLPAPRFPVADLELCRRLIRAAFAKRRKTLRNSFGAAPGLPGREGMEAALLAAGIDPGRRPETVSVEEYARLANIIHGA